MTIDCTMVCAARSRANWGEMDDEIHAAIAEVRAWAAREGGCMDHMTDAEVLDGIRWAAATMPTATVDIVRDHGLRRLAPVLARFIGSASDTKH